MMINSGNVLTVSSVHRRELPSVNVSEATLIFASTSTDVPFVSIHCVLSPQSDCKWEEDMIIPTSISVALIFVIFNKPGTN